MSFKSTSTKSMISLVLSLIALSSILSNLFNFRPTNIKSVVKGPTDSQRLAFVDKICGELPKPEQFIFVDRTSLISSYKIEATYKFKTDRSFDEIAPIFIIWFSSNGWRRLSNYSLEFRKDKYTINIVGVNEPNYNYSISCAEKE